MVRGVARSSESELGFRFAIGLLMAASVVERQDVAGSGFRSDTMPLDACSCRSVLLAAMLQG